MTDMTHIANAAGLELHGRTHRGLALDAVWIWPVGGQSVGMDVVLACIATVQVDDDDTTRYCKLQRLGADDQPIWLLGNGSRDLVCSVNARTLSAGQQVRLDHGDVIEIGFTRFEVCLTGQGGVTDAQTFVEPMRTSAGDEGFDLTLLADVPRTPFGAAAQESSSGHADFSDLIPMEPVSATRPRQPVAGVSAQDPLEVLHQQYLHKLHNPSAADNDLLWVDITRGDPRALVDPLQSLMEAAGPHNGLDDLLGQPQSIHSVLQSLNPVGAQDVLAPETFDSVMHLFAPEGLRQREAESLELLVQRSLPGLTRKEHHSLSVDSAMPYLSDEATQGSKAQPRQDAAA